MSRTDRIQAVALTAIAAIVAASAVAQASPRGVKRIEKVAEDKNPTRATKDVAVIQTSFGTIEIEFFEADAPEHVANFKKLVRSGFYDGTTFHRVFPDGWIQGGDPNSKDNDPSNDGQGGPGYTLPAEIKRPHKRGAIAAARLPTSTNPEKRSSGSQFYILLKDQPTLDIEGYTIFARVVKGMDVVDRIAADERSPRGRPLQPVKITRVTIETR